MLLYQEKEIVILCEDPANPDYAIIRILDDKVNCFTVLKSDIVKKETNELQQDGIIGWNLEKRDLLVDLPSQQDFIENNESISDLAKLKLDSLDAIDEANFNDLMNSLKRANDSIRPESPLREMIVEFLTLKVFDEKRSKRDKSYLEFYILPDEKRKDL